VSEAKNIATKEHDPQTAVIDGLWRNVLVGWVKRNGEPISLTVTSHVIIGRFEAGRYFRPELS
jgi:hypothetical protein